MHRMPDPPAASDWTVKVWNVRELTLNVGCEAAVWLKEWQPALDLSAEMVQSLKDRGAGALEVARARLIDTNALLGLGLYDDAGKLLLYCREVFERENAATGLGRVFSALANLEFALGHNEAAWRFEQTALRYKYAAGTPASINVSHFNLANYLTEMGCGWREVFGHRFAAAMIGGTTGSARLQRRIAALAGELYEAGDQASAALPRGFATLCTTVQRVEGVRFGELMLRLQPDEEVLNQLLHNIIAKAKQLAEGEPTQWANPIPSPKSLAGRLRGWLTSIRG
jgi:hypothetical protein